MRYLLIDDIKKHLNIDPWYHDDDYYIATLGDAVEDIVERHIDDNLKGLEDKNGQLPQPLIQAMLLLIGHFYANRESVAFGTPHEVPLAYQYILQLFQRYNFSHKTGEHDCCCGRRGN